MLLNTLHVPKENVYYKCIAKGLTQYLGTELASVWTGVIISMYATGNGEKCKNPADFDWFDCSTMEEKID